jgi:hypothetical protein
VGPYGHSKPMFTRLYYYSHDMPTTSWDTVIVSKWAPWLLWACNSSGFKGKTRQLGQHHPKRTKRGTKRHKGWPVAGTPGAPSWGTSILKLHI